MKKKKNYQKKKKKFKIPCMGQTWHWRVRGFRFEWPALASMTTGQLTTIGALWTDDPRFCTAPESMHLTVYPPPVSRGQGAQLHSAPSQYCSGICSYTLSAEPNLQWLLLSITFVDCLAPIQFNSNGPPIVPSMPIWELRLHHFIYCK